MRFYFSLLGLIIIGGTVNADSLAEKYLYQGKLQEGEAALMAHLKKEPKDDEARLGLGVVQFFMTFEHFGTSLYDYGLRTEDTSLTLRRQLRKLLPQNRNPKTISYKDAQKIWKTVAEDLAKVEATLAKVDTSKVKLAIRPGLIKVKFWPPSPAMNAPLVMSLVGMQAPRDKIEGFLIKFDGGDVHWLRGYCHFLAAWTDLLLALDGKELFDSTAHLVFDKVDTPHKFLLENRKAFDEVIRFGPREFGTVADIVTGFHLSLRFEIEDPDRMRSALHHIEDMIGHAKEMWKHYAAETDDDHEWIPNPKQKGVLQIPVRQEMIDTWLATIKEAELVVQGKRLIPFWRGENNKRGLNVRKVFMDPRRIDIVRWVQGTAATPYQEEGMLTAFANPQPMGRINREFGGPQIYVGFANWSN